VAADYEYDSSVWIVVLGKELSFTLICLACYLLFWPMSYMNNWVGRRCKKLTENFIFNFFLRTWIEIYLFTALACVFQM
jgi:hypothetical protein